MSGSAGCGSADTWISNRLSSAFPLSLECCYLDADKPVCFDHATASRLRSGRVPAGGTDGQDAHREGN